MPSMRNPLKKKLRPVNSEINPPMMNSDKPQTAPLARKAVAPVVMKYGITGIAAPQAKATNELAAADHGQPGFLGSGNADPDEIDP